MSRVCINGRFLSQPQSGVQRYAAELVKALDRLVGHGECGRHSFVLLTPPNARDDLHPEHIPIEQVGRLTGHLWEQIELPAHAHDDLLLNMCNTGPMYSHKQIVTIHDAAVFAVPQTYSPAFRAWYRLLLRRLAKSAAITTVSEFSRREIARHLGADPAKVRVIPEGREHILRNPSDESVLDAHGLRERPYVLAVSSITPNKNFYGIARAVELLGDAGFDIAIAGGTSGIYGRGGGLPGWVKHLGYVTDGQLRSLYEHAACFVYPSFYEGFGLPPLEAMTLGCPVVVSSAASLPGVCGKAALYCDPHDPRDIATKMRTIMEDGALRERLRRIGLERSTEFNWDTTARMMLEVVKEAAGV